MNRLYRKVPITNENHQEETWIYNHDTFNVEVTRGKPVDIMSLKVNMVENFDLTVKEWFRDEYLETVTNCPICGEKKHDAKEVFRVYGESYYQCRYCGHCFLTRRLSKKSLEKYFKEDKKYRITYTDRRNAKIRVNQVAIPKLEWVFQQFERIYQRKPKMILDVGAGSGHFVYACRQKGTHADGIEISHQGIEFCRNVFGIELMNRDFLKEHSDLTQRDYDLITFWGVIECVSDPFQMIKVASEMLNGKEGMIVVEVPRWDSFSTAIQFLFSESIVRHLDPIGHVHLFTDSSLVKTFVDNQFDLVSVWYFGMDIYELITQMSYALKDDQVIEKMKYCIPGLQNQLDLGTLSDEMVFACVPRNRTNS